jgi:hypothetical protein
MNVALQVPSFREGEDMVPTLDALLDQQVPQYVENLSLEVWVTLSPPSRELCTTWQTALRQAGFEPFEAPSGKLSARNAAHDSAVERGFDVIVVCDADAPPLHDGVLKALLDPFEKQAADAVRGHPVSRWHIFGTLENVARRATRSIHGHMHGQLSAFTAKAWGCAGPFDETVDQTNINEVWPEEEFDFADRLRDCGKLVDAPEAKVRNDSRRTRCRFERAFAFSGRGVNSWCADRGVETFEPRD